MGLLDKLRKPHPPDDNRQATPTDFDRTLAKCIAARDTSVEFSPATPLDELGLNSIELLEIVGHLEETLASPIPDVEIQGLATVADLHAMCLRHRVTLDHEWELWADPHARQAFSQVGEVLDGLLVLPDGRWHRFMSLVLGHDGSDVLITPHEGFEAYISPIGRQRYPSLTAPHVVAEVMRLASVKRVDTHHHGMIGPGSTGGEIGTRYHTSVARSRVWFKRGPQAVRVAIRAADFETEASFPPPLGNL